MPQQFSEYFSKRCGSSANISRMCRAAMVFWCAANACQAGELVSLDMYAPSRVVRQDNPGQRRQGELQRMRITHPRDVFAHQSGAIAHVAAGVVRGIAVEQFVVASGLWHADAVCG